MSNPSIRKEVVENVVCVNYVLMPLLGVAFACRLCVYNLYGVRN